MLLATWATLLGCRGGGEIAPDDPTTTPRAARPNGPTGAPTGATVVSYRALTIGANGTVVPIVSPDAALTVRIEVAAPGDDAPGGMWVALAATTSSAATEGAVAPPHVLAVVPADGRATLVRVDATALAAGGDGSRPPDGLVALAGAGPPPFPERVARWLASADAPPGVGRLALPLAVRPPPDPAVLDGALAAHTRGPAGCALDEPAWQAAVAALDAEGRAGAWERLGKAWFACQDLARMRAAFDRAAEVAQGAGLPTLAARALRVRASREIWAGRLDEALAALERARQATPAADVVGEVRWANTRAWVDGLLGETAAAFERLRDGLALAERHGLDYEAAYFRMSQAALLSDLGQHARARRLFDATRGFFAASWARTPDPRDAVGRSYGVFLGNAAWDLLTAPPFERRPADLETAEWDLLRARALVRAAGEPVREANVLANLAYAAWQEDASGPSGGDGRARALLAEADALAGTLPGMHQTFVAWLRGRIALDEGRPGDALAAFDRLAGLEGGPQADEIAWRATWGRARAREALGASDEAAAGLDAAVAAIERLGRRTPLFESRAAFLGSREEPFLDALRLRLDLGDAEAAVAIAERARAQVLRSVEARLRPERVPPERRAAWRERMAAIHAARTAWEEAPADVAAERDARRQALLTALDEAQTFLESAVPDVGAAPASVADLRALLGPDDAFLYFVVRPGELVSLLVPREGPVAVRRRLVPADRLARLARRFREAFDEDALWYDLLAGELGALVFGPWSDALPAGRIVLLPHGPLHDLPLHLLPATPGGSPLLASHVVSYAPSGGLLRPRPGPRAADARPLVVGDPTGDLPHAAAEARAVAAVLPNARLLLGDAAGRPAVLAALPRASSVFWAGHAELDEDQVWWSHLRAAGGAHIPLIDVLGLPLCADLVVLSGCATGRQAVPAAGEPLGLADGFLAAGARAVVATLRPVRDADSQRFVLRFLDELRTAPGPATALARTQRAFAAASGVDAMPRSSWGAYRIVAGPDRGRPGSWPASDR